MIGEMPGSLVTFGPNVVVFVVSTTHNNSASFCIISDGHLRHLIFWHSLDKLICP